MIRKEVAWKEKARSLAQASSRRRLFTLKKNYAKDHKQELQSLAIEKFSDTWYPPYWLTFVLVGLANPDGYPTFRLQCLMNATGVLGETSNQFSESTIQSLGKTISYNNRDRRALPSGVTFI